MVIGEEKGRGVNDKVMRNFGMPKAEGYRKALRLMELAERFNMPVITLIDAPGAYLGIDSEERNIRIYRAKPSVMSRLKTPIICTVIGEGSSGGALAIGVGDDLICCSTALTLLYHLKAVPILSGKPAKKPLRRQKPWV